MNKIKPSDKLRNVANLLTEAIRRLEQLNGPVHPTQWVEKMHKIKR